MVIPLNFPQAKASQISPFLMSSTLKILGLQGLLKVTSFISPASRQAHPLINPHKSQGLQQRRPQAHCHLTLPRCACCQISAPLPSICLHFVFTRHFFLIKVVLFSSTRHSVDIIVCCYGNSVISQQTLKGQG